MSRIIKNPFERKQKGIAVLHLNFLKQLVFTILVVLFLPIACTKNPPEEPEELVANITMTTLAADVSIWVRISLSAGSDNFAIDWGDGEESNMDNFSFQEPYPHFDHIDFQFSHSYSSATEHCITITGDNIEMLQCGWNSLTSLDVSRYPELKSLYCLDNQLTDLDVSKNTALEFLWCEGNPLTALNLSNSLTTLFARDCLLTTLDLSKSTALTGLIIDNCLLTTLNLSENTALGALYCEGNQLTGLDVSNNAELVYLSCSWNRLTASALNDLFRSLPDKTDTGHTGNINIYSNPGASDCDFSIAMGKGWRQWYPGPKSMKNSEELYFNFLQQFINNKNNKRYE